MDVTMSDIASEKPKPLKAVKGHEIASRTIKTPAFSYAWLELMSETPSDGDLDNLTVRSYLTSALRQFLGLTGTAISIDILKVEGKECWIRVAREDIRAVIAAIGGWIGGSTVDQRVSWKVKASGNWLGSLVAAQGMKKLWMG
jgi:ribonuclease P/MRP protein subunit POP8